MVSTNDIFKFRCNSDLFWAKISNFLYLTSCAETSNVLIRKRRNLMFYANNAIFRTQIRNKFFSKRNINSFCTF